MAWVIDGNNVLGQMRVSRDSTESKRQLVRLLGGFARAKRTTVFCYFDGPEPPAFGRQLGNVRVIFSGRRPADDLITAKVAEGRDWNVVTSDRTVASRTAGRRVTVVPARQFLSQLEAAGLESGETPDEDWLDYFSDPQNRNAF
ncbi:MAG TPA: NYN domain-containing protein [Thermoanaerobaculia bacterium]|nr:NYN domain-containing protein [Thermoanaerobaculia bacterium]